MNTFLYAVAERGYRWSKVSTCLPLYLPNALRKMFPRSLEKSNAVPRDRGMTGTERDRAHSGSRVTSMGETHAGHVEAYSNDRHSKANAVCSPYKAVPLPSPDALSRTAQPVSRAAAVKTLKRKIPGSRARKPVPQFLRGHPGCREGWGGHLIEVRQRSGALPFTQAGRPAARSLARPGIWSSEIKKCEKTYLTSSTRHYPWHTGAHVDKP